MCKFNPKNDARRMDPCMKPLIEFLNDYGIFTKGCCCGHGKYPMSIIAWDYKLKSYVEIISMKVIPRKKKFYKKDKPGYYFIPETLEKNK